MWNFRHGIPAFTTEQDFVPFLWIVGHPGDLTGGLSFSATLLGILLAHEFGHWALCARHRIMASWPYLLPAPTLSGTAGAVIRIRFGIPSLNALMDVGIAGPIAGFVVAVPATLLGLLLSKPAVGPAQPVPTGRRVGVYHIGFKVGDTDDALRAVLVRLHKFTVPLIGASDHGVTHSLYMHDPDGNEIELYIDVPGVDWRSDPSLAIGGLPRPLRL